MLYPEYCHSAHVRSLLYAADTSARAHPKQSSRIAVTGSGVPQPGLGVIQFFVPGHHNGRLDSAMS